MLKSQLSPLMIKHFRRSRSPNIIFLAFFGVCLHSFVAPVFSTLVRWAISTGRLHANCKNSSFGIFV